MRKRPVISSKPARKTIGGKGRRGKAKGKKSRFGPAGIVGRGFLKGTTGI